MFAALIKSTVFALAGELLDEHGLRGTVAREEAAAHLLGQMGAMPDYLRFPFALLTVVFALGGLARGGLFHRLPSKARRAQMRGWREGRLSFMRDFMKFHEGLLVFYAVSRAGLPGGEEAS